MNGREEYVTLDTVIRQLNQGGLTFDEAERQVVRDLIVEASSAVAQRTGRYFWPWLLSRPHDYQRPYQLVMHNEDLLEVTSITNYDNEVLDPSTYVLKPYHTSVKHTIELLPSGGKSFGFTTDWQQAILVTGWWGYHEFWSRAWMATGLVVPAGDMNATDTETTLIIADTEVKNAFGRQRLEEGQLVKVDSEVMLVGSIDEITDAVVFLRAQQGTTIATHSSGTPILGFVQTPAIEKLLTRLVTWLYKHRDVTGGAVQLLNGTAILRDDELRVIMDEVDSYQRVIGAYT